jgi:uncharacterized protein
LEARSDASERALGGVASDATGTQAWGGCITNATDADYSSISVSFVGEQWRDSGVDTASKLSFAYTTSATIAADLATHIGAGSGNDASTGWLEVAALDFTGPIATTTATALDGNVDANNTAVSATIPDLVVAANATVCIRWVDLDDAGSDHGLAIDDLVVKAMTPG